MSKRKAPRDDNFLVPSSSSQNASQISTQVLNEHNNVSSPKKKRFSQNFSDLSQLNDINSSKVINKKKLNFLFKFKSEEFDKCKTRCH